MSQLLSSLKFFSRSYMLYHDAVSKTPSCPNHFCDLGAHSPRTAVHGRHISSSHDEDVWYVSLIRLSPVLVFVACCDVPIFAVVHSGVSVFIAYFVVPILVSCCSVPIFISAVIPVLSRCLVVLLRGTILPREWSQLQAWSGIMNDYFTGWIIYENAKSDNIPNKNAIVDICQ